MKMYKVWARRIIDIQDTFQALCVCESSRVIVIDDPPVYSREYSLYLLCLRLQSQMSSLAPSFRCDRLVSQDLQYYAPLWLNNLLSVLYFWIIPKGSNDFRNYFQAVELKKSFIVHSPIRGVFKIVE